VALTRRRATWLGLGGGLLAMGLALVGYVAWQLIGTNIVSERRQTELVEQLEDQWRTSPGTELNRLEPVAVGDASALIRIPRFGDDYVIPVLEGVGEDELASGFGHFVDSAGPGRKGNYALAGHRVTHGEPLRNMPSLRPGDTVIIETRDTVYTYEIDTDPNQLVVDLAEVWVLAAQPVNPRSDGVEPRDEPRLLTLVTCAELFHTDDRMVVFGHLVDRLPR
jgi:sortase A